MALASSPADPSLDAEWQEWKRKYEKTYSQTSDEFWEMMTCSSNSVLKDQEIIGICLLSDIPVFEDVTEDRNVSPERDSQSSSWDLDGNAKAARVKKIPAPLSQKHAAPRCALHDGDKVRAGEKKKQQGGLLRYTSQPVL